MDPYTTKSLQYNDNEEAIQKRLREAINIFDNLADLYIGGILSAQYNTNEYMYLFLSNLIENDFKYPMDDNIIIQAKPHGYMHMSLKNTRYTMDQKANIYYIIYGWPFFHNYNSNPSFPVGQLDGQDIMMPSEGINLYKLPDRDVYKYDSFLKTFLADTPLASVGEDGTFGGSFVLLSMTYLTMNGYSDYLDALDGGFKARNEQGDDEKDR